MTHFHDVSFPLAIGFDARGGPVRTTEITPLASGREHRSTPHADARRRYNAALGLKSLDDIHTLIAFFEARRGPLYGFRFRDPMDHASGAPGATLSSGDQIVGTGDGVETQFQLVKSYGDQAGDYSRIITKPVLGTVLLAVSGESVNGTVDGLTGLVTLDAAPANGAIVSAGFQFDVPVRFDTEHLNISLESFKAGSAEAVPLLEVASDA